MNYQNGVFQVIFCMGKDVHRLNNHQQSDKPKPIRTNAELTKPIRSWDNHGRRYFGYPFENWGGQNCIV